MTKKLFNSPEDRKKILSQLGKVRESGEVNMADAKAVQKFAYEQKHYALVRHMGSNPSGRGYNHYMNLLEEFEEWMKENE